MNTGIWLVAGCMVAWLAFSTLRINLARGLLLSLVIGAAGAYLGGAVVAPAIGNSQIGADEFNPFALLVAFAVAAAAVIVSDMVQKRYGL